MEISLQLVQKRRVEKLSSEDYTYRMNRREWKRKYSSAFVNARDNRHLSDLVGRI
jgi:hypothetical protein